MEVRLSLKYQHEYKVLKEAPGLFANVYQLTESKSFMELKNIIG